MPIFPQGFLTLAWRSLRIHIEADYRGGTVRNLGQIVRGVLMVSASAIFLWAQSDVPAMDKARSPNDHSPDAPLDVPDSVLKVVKVKGTIEKVDLTKRTVTIASEKKNDAPLELTFSQPAGREQIKVSKKAEKVLGKNKLDLEELKAGSKVALEYYPVLQQVMSLTVEKPAA